MDYFVGIENTPYYHWQIELLIESFRQQGCQDRLLVALADTKLEPDAPNLTRNLLSHQRLYKHENIGAIRGYSPLNGLTALTHALRMGIISQPLIVVPPDTVLKKQADLTLIGFPEVIFVPDPFFTLEYVKKEIGPFWEWIKQEQKDFDTGWVPLSSLMVLSKIPLEILFQVIKLTELFATHQLLEDRPISNKTHVLAWIVVLMRYSKNIRLFGDYFLSMPLMGSGDCPFISYEHGMPPIFNKTMFSYSPPHYSSFGNPFQVLADNYPSPNAYYLSQLARKHLDTTAT